MGSNTTRIDQRIITDIVTKFSTEILTDMIQQSDNTASTIQNIKVTNSFCEVLLITQESSIEITSLSDMIANQASEVENAVVNEIIGNLESLVEQVNSKLNLAQNNETDTSQLISNHINTDVRNRVQTNIQQISQNTVNNTMNIVIDNVFADKCIIKQYSNVEIVSKSILQGTTDSVIRNLTQNSVSSSVKSVTKQKNEGVSIFGLLMALILPLLLIFGGSFIIPKLIKTFAKAKREAKKQKIEDQKLDAQLQRELSDIEKESVVDYSNTNDFLDNDFPDYDFSNTNDFLDNDFPDYDFPDYDFSDSYE